MKVLNHEMVIFSAISYRKIISLDSRCYYYTHSQQKIIDMDTFGMNTLKQLVYSCHPVEKNLHIKLSSLDKYYCHEMTLATNHLLNMHCGMGAHVCLA